ncbi:hypothetical protein LCGC14_0543850 [marine sediment metagenome]|uniref:Uncharacterized protein n=1 Tax=marine sediment metagenome TaxID=412755 RepID=A0A0F9UDJ4_9ZZZZ
MGNHPTTKCRGYKEGWIGRRRTYQCRECGKSFQVDTLNALPEINRACPDCLKRTSVYTFENKQNGKQLKVRASDSKLATARAWKINSNFTFKIPQPTIETT